jgi:para-aminobenzoate synthetase/4-amino-4-deoxychorismate lyase
VWEPGTVESGRTSPPIAAIREAISRGDTYQVNHTMRLRARFDGDPLGAWADLRRAQRDGWFGYVDTGRHHAVASVSPELFFTWDGRQVVTRPMKGTRARSRDAAARRRSGPPICSPPAKDRAENLMIVDLLRNDVAKGLASPDRSQVPSLFDVEAYPTVWQLTSTVTGLGRSR